MLEEIINFIEKNPASAAIISALITSILAIILHYLKSRAERVNKHYQFIVDKYQDYCCALYKLLAILQEDSCFKEKIKIEITVNPQDNFSYLDFPLHAYLCTAGQARLASDHLVCELMNPVTKCILDRVKNKSDNYLCNENIEQLLMAMNNHIRRLRYWCVIRVCLDINVWFKAQKIRKERQKT